MNSNKRVFLIQAVTATAGALLASQSLAQTKPATAPVKPADPKASSGTGPANKVDPKSTQATALSYVEKTTEVDAKKFPKHTKEQKCSNCQLYAQDPTEGYGKCGIFPGKLVASDGWCSAYVKKAG